MIALLIVTIAVFALVAVQIHSVRAQLATTERHTASVLAASLADQAIAALEEDFDAPVGAARQPSLIQGYAYQLEVTDEAAGLKGLKVNVYWNDRHGSHVFLLETKVLDL